MTAAPVGPVVARARAVSWRVAAVAVIAVISGLILLSRLAHPAVTPASSDVVRADNQRAPSARATPLPVSARYADGIPTEVRGKRVVRVADALQLPAGRSVLVGGWYLRRECKSGPGLRRCAKNVLADARLDVVPSGYLSTDWVVISGDLRSSGPQVVDAVLQDDPDCSIRRAGRCQPLLQVVRVVWSLAL